MCKHVQADLIVVGGGIAGCAAAVAAARLGIKAVLVQNRPVLGGNASSEIGLLMAGADRDFPHARETGIVEEIDLVNRYHNHEVQWRNEISDVTLEHLVTDAGVELYLNTHVHEIELRDDGTIESAAGAQQATEKTFRFQAPLFVDATGDGTLATMAGAEIMTGGESRDAFGESLAPEQATHVTQGSTLMYRVKDMGKPVAFNKPSWAYSFPDADDLPVAIKDLDKPQLWIEYGAELNTILDAVQIREELLRILYGVWDHIKNHGNYGAENYVLSWVGSVPGKRESRRVVGDYVLSQKNLTQPSELPDAVAYGGWPIDVHNPAGFYAEKKWLDYTHLDQPYPIPYRCYYSRDVDNLFLAGRIISATHVAHGSTRLIRTCGVGGQAVGTAAALCIKYGMLPRALGRDHIAELQQALLKHDCHIPGIRNQDPDDLAPRAQIRASSEFTDPESDHAYAAQSVVSGLSRGTVDAENLWMSAPMSIDSEPWIALRWDDPVKVSCVHLTFDTGVREQRFFDRPVLGAVRTCVKDCLLEYASKGGDWQPLVEVSGNFLRHRILTFDTITTRALRVRMTATNGDKHARLYEIRAYAEN